MGQLAFSEEEGEAVIVDVGVVRTCTSCGVSKPAGDFSPNKLRRDGLQSYCRACARAMVRRLRGVVPREGFDLSARGERCEVCDGVGTKGVFLDHDHRTGRPRGWLCHGCNTSLGMLGDDPLRIAALFFYVLARGSAEERLDPDVASASRAVVTWTQSGEVCPMCWAGTLP